MENESESVESMPLVDRRVIDCMSEMGFKCDPFQRMYPLVPDELPLGQRTD